MPANKRLAVWMSEKKLQKINWQELVGVCSKYGFEVFKLDLNKSIEEQGPFCVLLHKLTDIIASANQGDIRVSPLITAEDFQPDSDSDIHRSKSPIINIVPQLIVPKPYTSNEIINAVEDYLKSNPSITVLDPIPNVKQLLDRYNCYSIIHASDLHNYGVFTPNFCVLRNGDLDVIRDELKNSLVTYPFICKPILGHGSRQAHEMSIIFDEKHLIDCRTPCVAQSFINHNAILYKIFIVGDSHYYVERPSLKNFHASQRESIYFDSSDVSKADSKSRLSVLDPDDVVLEKWEPDPKVMEVIASTLRKSFGMDLLGIDVVIENTSGRYAIIDVNAYPGYDGFPNFFDALLECISKKVTSD